VVHWTWFTGKAAHSRSRTKSRFTISVPCGQAAPGAIGFPGADCAIGLAGTIASPYFSPHTNRGERFLGPDLDLCCRRWHPAKTPGVLRIASSVLHILPQTTVTPDFRHSSSPRDRAKGSAGTFQRGKFPALNAPTSPERHFSKALPQVPTKLCGTHGTHQAWIDSRNPTTITTQWKHRQPIFLHPTVETGAIRQADLSQRSTALAGPAC
jgi:hypothetical protein